MNIYEYVTIKKFLLLFKYDHMWWLFAYESLVLLLRTMCSCVSTRSHGHGTGVWGEGCALHDRSTSSHIRSTGPLGYTLRGCEKIILRSYYNVIPICIMYKFMDTNINFVSMVTHVVLWKLDIVVVAMNSKITIPFL